MTSRTNFGMQNDSSFPQIFFWGQLLNVPMKVSLGKGQVVDNVFFFPI